VIGRDDLLVPSIVTVGGLVTFYTMLGGIKAVIWTDVLQFCIMLAGLLGAVVVAWRAVPGGLAGILDAAGGLGTAQAAPPPGPAGGLLDEVGRFFATPLSGVGLFIAMVVSRVGTYTSDQVMVQRFQTTRSIGDSRRSIIITALSDVLWMTALVAMGVSLFAYYGGRLPPAVAEDPDKILPHFMREAFPTGMLGLAIAGILAASLSSVDSALNSMTSVAVVDFYHRIFRGRPDGGRGLAEAEGRRQVTVSRLFTLLIGVAGIVLSSNVGRLGTVFEISNKLINGFTGPLLGIFLLGMFTRRANGTGALAGGIAGTAVSLALLYLSSLPRPVIGFLWPSTFGLATTLIVGYLVSLAVALFGGSSAAASRGERWTFSGVLSGASPTAERDDRLPAEA
jgi:SSS family transporter